MSNMMPGDNSGAEPRPHREDCASFCAYADLDWEELGMCPWDHATHDCNCDELDQHDDADAWADWASDHYPV